MSYFGIQGYTPRWRNGLPATATAHGPRLRGLVGRSLCHAWLLWDLDDDTWFADGPVLLDFDREQVEINHQKFDDLSITWNTIDPAGRRTWTDGEDDHGFRLAWRDDARAELSALHGQRLAEVDLLEYVGGDLADGMVAVGFTFPAGRVAISNGLDENRLEFGALSGFRRHRLAR